MRVGRMIIAALLGLGSLAGAPTTEAHADACEAASDAINRVGPRYKPKMEHFVSAIASAKTDAERNVLKCDYAKLMVTIWIETIPIKEKAERECGARLKTKCDSSCVRSHLAEKQAEVGKICLVTPIQPTPQRKPSCNPRSSVETRSEGAGSMSNKYEVIVVDNDCPYKVRFHFLSTPTGGGETKERPTPCVPANTSRHEALRSSSTSLARLTAQQKHIRCD